MNKKFNNQEYPITNRQYKSTLFCKVFAEKKYLLGLYNSVNGTDYQNEDELEVNTIEGIVYLSVKNDLSFLIDCNMSLYEHQITYNPNMPLRGLLHFAQLYNKYVESRALNIYSTRLQPLPVPKYVVFYNGTKEQPDETILLLSEAFQQSANRSFEPGCLECEARMLNINYGHNFELMQKCRRLEEYAIFISRVRYYAKKDTLPKEIAIEKAVEDCIEEGILKEFLIEQKAEVLDMILTTFDKEMYEKALKEDAIREGLEEGRAKGLEEGRAKGLEEGRAKGLEEGRAKGLEEGRAEGRAEGEIFKLISLIQKKLNKNQSVEQIAEAIEEDVETVNQLIKEYIN